MGSGGRQGIAPAPSCVAVAGCRSMPPGVIVTMRRDSSSCCCGHRSSGCVSDDRWSARACEEGGCMLQTCSRQQGVRRARQQQPGSGRVHRQSCIDTTTPAFLSSSCIGCIAPPIDSAPPSATFAAAVTALLPSSSALTLMMREQPGAFLVLQRRARGAARSSKGNLQRVDAARSPAHVGRVPVIPEHTSKALLLRGSGHAWDLLHLLFLPPPRIGSASAVSRRQGSAAQQLCTNSLQLGVACRAPGRACGRTAAVRWAWAMRRGEEPFLV